MRLIFVLILSACCISSWAGAQTATDAPMRMPAPIFQQRSTDAVPDGPIKEVRIFHDTLPAGVTTPWHVHDAAPIFYVISGDFTLEFKDRPSVVVHAGEGYVEPVGVAMRGHSGGSAPTEFVIVQVSDPAKPFLRMASP